MCVNNTAVKKHEFWCLKFIFCDKKVGPVAQSIWRLATGWTVWGSNPGGARFSAPAQTGPGAHPASCTMGTGSFPGVKSGRGVTLTPHPLLVPWSRKSRGIPLHGPYGLYRASVPVQGCTLYLVYFVSRKVQKIHDSSHLSHRKHFLCLKKL